MNPCKTLIILTFIFIFIVPGRAEYIAVKNMDSYGDGNYSDDFGFIGNSSSTDAIERIQYFTVDSNVSTDRLEWQIAKNNSTPIQNYTVIIYKAVYNTDFTITDQKIVYVNVSMCMKVGFCNTTFPSSIELKKDQVYGVKFFVDRDGNYNNHEGTGIAGTSYVYLNVDTNPGITWKMRLWDGTQWLADAKVLNLTFYQNNSIIHMTDIPVTDPTFSTVHSWTLAPTLDQVCNTSWTLNGVLLGWSNSTNNPSVTIFDSDTNFDQYSNNSLVIKIYNSLNANINLTKTFYINQTIVYHTEVITDVYNPVYQTDSNGVLWEYAGAKVYNSTNGLVSKNIVTTTSGLTATGRTSIFIYNATTQFASSDDATGNGVWRSTDTGHSFQKVLNDHGYSWKIYQTHLGQYTHPHTTSRPILPRSTNPQISVLPGQMCLRRPKVDGIFIR